MYPSQWYGEGCMKEGSDVFVRGIMMYYPEENDAEGIFELFLNDRNFRDYDNIEYAFKVFFS